MNLIEFHGTDEALRSFPRPYPASKAVPDWLKNMPMDFEGDPEKRTLKRCAPFLEAMTSGYVIPCPGDCHFTMDDKGVISVQSPHKMLDAHFDVQYKGAPFERVAVLKFRNPWVIKTPPGYSTLFIQPINRFGIPFTFFTGMVETDTYYHTVHFPAACNLPRGRQFTFKAGTPLMQAIPIRRENWSSEVVQRDEARFKAMSDELSNNPHLYRQEYWQKREFT